MERKADIGMVGLAVMGSNLAKNMESKGFTVAVYNREPEMTDAFMEKEAGKNFIANYDYESLVASIRTPRVVFMMIRAGSPVDQVIDALLPLLDDGDIIVDGGNSNYEDTMRRTAYVESKGKLFIGTGVSGGEEGALLG
ncbi:MAG: NADP-dependent phosphogluconate dehydrogenase, partial [Lachnospiraceae bacterium]|nr:NADP-dependent phosphogluconate dehydrogenase [Lachnospiraceae bacterium]